MLKQMELVHRGKLECEAKLQVDSQISTQLCDLRVCVCVCVCVCVRERERESNCNQSKIKSDYIINSINYFIKHLECSFGTNSETTDFLYAFYPLVD